LKEKENGEKIFVIRFGPGLNGFFSENGFFSFNHVAFFFLSQLLLPLLSFSCYLKILACLLIICRTCF